MIMLLVITLELGEYYSVVFYVRVFKDSAVLYSFIV